MSVTLPKGLFDPVDQLAAIKREIIKQDLPRILASEQKKGFPEDYNLIMTQRGRRTKRKLYTLSPQFFNIGNVRSPTTFEFIGDGSWELAVEAIKYAVSLFIRRAPARTGKYLNSLEIEAGGYRLRPGGLKRMATTLDAKDRIYVGPTVEYASTLEAGNYTGYYQNALRGGIMFYIAKAVNDKYGAAVSCRMIYMNLEGGKYAQPVLEFGIGGAFASNSTRPGTNIRRRARRSRR